MLTWAVVHVFTVVKGHNGLWLCGAMAGDCFMAYCAASAFIGKWP